MSEKRLYLVLVVFNSIETAETALEQLPKKDTRVVSAVVMQKDADEKVLVKDVGRTPIKGTVGGALIGGVVGLLTGGTGLLLGSLGAVVGHHRSKRRDMRDLIPDHLGKVTGSLGPSSSAIIAVVKDKPQESSLRFVEALNGKVYTALVPQDAAMEMDEQAEEAYAALLTALAADTGGEAKTTVPYKKIHVVINPVSGKDQPIINILNAVFNKYGIDWDISITKKFGDATKFARRAAEAGCDLVAGYGGDGTQHEIANGLMGTGVTMGVLPGGTGNGFGNELSIPTTLKLAVELLCTSYNKRKIDIVRVGDDYFIQRLFTGIEPEEQTSREDKNKYGTLAYVQRDLRRLREIQDIPYQLVVDGEKIEIRGHKCYVVNSAKAGTGLSISNQFQVDDGYLDIFMISRSSKSADAALSRFFNLDTDTAGMYYWRGQEIVIDADPDQPVWTDGEYTARTPVTMKVIPGGLTVAVS